MGSDERKLEGSVSPPMSRTFIRAALAVVVAMFAILGVVLWRTGVFDNRTSASTAPAVAAIVGVFGGLIASAVSLVGLLLKQSIDRRTAQLARETEQRLRLETSIKAVELLTMPDGKPAPRARQTGAIFVLGSQPLAQLDLALPLLAENWGSGNIGSSAAVWVIDRALTQPNEDLQRIAAEMLKSHANLLPASDGSDFAWPACASLVWPTKLDRLAQIQLVNACINGLASRKPQAWCEGAVNFFTAEFNVIRKADRAPEIWSAAVLVLDVLLDWTQRRYGDYSLFLPEGRTHLSDLRAELTPNVIDSAQDEVSEQVMDVVGTLRADWGQCGQQRSRGLLARLLPRRARTEEARAQLPGGLPTSKT